MTVLPNVYWAFIPLLILTILGSSWFLRREARRLGRRFDLSFRLAFVLGQMSDHRLRTFRWVIIGWSGVLVIGLFLGVRSHD